MYFLFKLKYAYPCLQQGGRLWQQLQRIKKVGDITVRELKSLIRDSIYEVVDPDYGLELRPDVEASLKNP